MREAAYKHQICLSDTLEGNKDFQIMRTPFPKEFGKRWNEGFKHYLKGRFLEAKREFEKVLEIKADDKPSKLLLDYMKSMEYLPRIGW